MTATKRLPLDAFMFAAFLAAYRPLTTGLSLHEWLAVALVTPILVHSVLNWDWAVRVTASFSRRLRAKTRVNLVVDVALYLSTVTVMVSGFMVSRVIAQVLGFSATQDPLWYRVHSVSADAAIGLALLHTALHWRWFLRVIETRFAGRSRAATSARPVGRAPRGAQARDVIGEGSWWAMVPERVRDDYRRSQNETTLPRSRSGRAV